MPLSINRLSTGWWRISGNGPCNWVQVQMWPDTEDEIRAGAFPGASEEFLREVIETARELMEKEAGE